MKILEICPFSQGGCGVWARAREEAVRLSKLSHEVKVFSTNAVKGTNEIAPKSDKIENVEITRFPFKKLGGESFMYWNFENEALEFSPDVIITHNYRHIHTEKSLKVAQKLKSQGKNCKVFLVTHAPFVEGNITRSWLATLAVKFYDATKGKRTLNQFDKILVISQWEIPYLKELGVKEEKIIYIPNGIPEEFFKQKKSKEENKILFLGRISEKKKLETLIEAVQFIKDKKTKIEIVGPKEFPYSNKIEELVKKLNLQDRIYFSEPVYDVKEKIKKLDSAKIYVLPSRVEGMPQALIEAMAREKIVIGSNSIAIRDLIEDGKNGFLFEYDNPKSLAEKIDLALSSKNSQIKSAAKKSVENFSWNKVIKKLEGVISEK